MKTKKSLFLMVMFLFIALIIGIPNNVLATEMSDEFKQILNEEGKLVVTESTISEDRLDFLNKYMAKYSTSEYFFGVNTVSEDYTKCHISLNYYADPNICEGYELEIVYEEQYSDEFKSILKDGKLVLPTTSKNMNLEWVETYMYSLAYGYYSFSIDTYVTDPLNGETSKLINEELTKATIIMTNGENHRQERHVVELVKATEPSDEFKKFLNEDGKLEMNSIKPASADDFGVLFDVLIRGENQIWPSYIAEDCSSCDLTLDNETHTVDVVYNYDNAVKEKMQEFVKNFPEDIEYFKVQDMELISYWVNNVGIDSEEEDSFACYSGELKSYMNNYNAKLEITTGAGSDQPFVTARAGYGAITYNDIAYYVSAWIGAKGQHIIYVPDTTADSKEELMAAAQKRINEYLGKDDIAIVSYAGNAMDAWVNSYYEMTKPEWYEWEPDLTIEEWKMG